MVTNSFTLYSLSGQRIIQAVQNSDDCNIDRYTLLGIIRILHDNYIELLSRPQYEDLDALALAKNIYALDPHRLDYVTLSEAEYEIMGIFSNTAYEKTACNLLNLFKDSEFSFVQNPNTPNEKIWNYGAGTSPCVFLVNEKVFLPVDDPIIKSANNEGEAKSMRKRMKDFAHF